MKIKSALCTLLGLLTATSTFVLVPTHAQEVLFEVQGIQTQDRICLLYTSPRPRD